MKLNLNYTKKNKNILNMARLAIRGHATRGKEVIDTLKMLGGKIQQNSFFGDNADNIYCWYYIDKEGYIVYTHYTFFNDITNSSNITFFTLEEFLEKFPYKVGDKVSVYGYETKVCIDEMKWDGFNIQYLVFTDETEWYSAEELNKYNELYKEETKEEIIIDTIKESKDRYRLHINHQYEIEVDEGEYYAVRRKPQYPKTFIEVLDFWNPDRQIEDDYQRCYKKDVIEKFHDLLYARDAYWKIAGEQMGLGKPWKPDWDWREYKFCIGTIYDKIEKFHVGPQNYILAFPTEEMRDMFYENFKDLIESCKEFL